MTYKEAYSKLTVNSYIRLNGGSKWYLVERLRTHSEGNKKFILVDFFKDNKLAFVNHKQIAEWRK